MPPFLLLGSPWKREIPSRCAARQFSWFLDFVRAQHDCGKRESIGNLVYVGRSILIGTAKEVQKARHPDLVHVQMDSDAYPLASGPDSLKFAQEAFDSGFGLVCAPVHNIEQSDDGSATVIQEWHDIERSRADGPWEVDSSSFTQVFIAPLLLQRLTPGGLWTPIGQDGNPEKRIPLYTWSDQHHTEDRRLIEIAKKLGFPTACDARLKVKHYKEALVDGYGLLAEEREVEWRSPQVSSPVKP